MRRLQILNLFLVIGISFGLNANAAQIGKVIVNSAEIHEFPNVASKVIGTVAKDESYAVSNIPTEGYYKIRLNTGEIGWVSGNEVFVMKAGAPEVDSEETASGKQKNEEPQKKTARAAKKRSKKYIEDEEQPEEVEDRLDRSRILLGLGLQYPVYEGLGSHFVTEGLNPGYAGLLEFQFQLEEDSAWYWAARAEYTWSKKADVLLADGTQQIMKQTAIPLQIGSNWAMVQSPRFRLGAGVYVGMAILSSVKVEQTKSQKTIISFDSYDPCATLSLQASFGLARSLSIFAEGGYRFQKSGTLAATVWETQLVPEFSITSSAPMARFGLEFRF